MKDLVEFYLDKKHEWRWHRRSPNGAILADSGEGYKNYEDCFAMAARVNGGDYECHTTSVNPENDNPR